MKNLFLIAFCAMMLSWPLDTSASNIAGDVDGDGKVGISDITTIIDCLLSSYETAADMVCDVDGDGFVTISDVTALIDLLMMPSTPQDQDVAFTINGVDIKMVFVEGGTFKMGCTPDQWPDVFRNEGPVHEVTVWSYYICETEVTQELWQAVMGTNPSKFTGDPKRPVEMVSMFDCARFVDKLSEITGKSFRLPTEAEWEFAARGGTKSRAYKYSGSNIVDDVAWYIDNSGETTHAVASKMPNELGIYDMSGNVCEWCQDWYSGYLEGAFINPVGPESGYDNVYRSGAWSFYASQCRNAFRLMADPLAKEDYLGFRVAMNY